jgi:hypothetical protein
MTAPKFAKGDRVTVATGPLRQYREQGEITWLEFEPAPGYRRVQVRLADNRDHICHTRDLTPEHYPLWCYDSGEGDSRYTGPFNTEVEAEAAGAAVYGFGEVRRCRRLLASEADIGRDELFDLLVTEFNDPMPWRVAAIGSIWWPDETSLVKVKSGSAEKLAALLDEIFEVNVFVCEGDE